MLAIHSELVVINPSAILPHLDQLGGKINRTLKSPFSHAKAWAGNPISTKTNCAGLAPLKGVG